MTPPINLKQSSRNSTASTMTTTAVSSPDAARVLVRETLRISANLATSSSPIGVAESNSAVVDETRFGLEKGQFVESSLRLICCEEIDGRKWKYVAENDGSGRLKKNSMRAISLQTPQAPAEVTFFVCFLFIYRRLFLCTSFIGLYSGF